MANPVKYHPAASFTPGGIKTIPLDLSGDVDLTDPAGQTGGYCARALLANAAGNITYSDIYGANQTQPVAASQELRTSASKVFSSSVACSAIL